jgi:flagellar biosynthesis protein FliQ
MLDSLFTNISASTLTLGMTLAVIFSSLALGLVISLVYILTHKDEEYSTGFTVTLIMLPAIIALIILLVDNNIARAFSLAGAFSLIRFRSATADSKDIAYVFFTLGVGLGCGVGFIGYAVLFTLILGLVMVVLTKVNYGKPRISRMQLKIVVPEDMNYQNTFDDILSIHTKSFKLVRVKTTDFGTLFELTYDVVLDNLSHSKDFIDQLRCRNGNLNVALSVKMNREQALF